MQPVLSVYGATVQPGTEDLLVELVMVGRSLPADPDWLAEVASTAGEPEWGATGDEEHLQEDMPMHAIDLC
jgi:2,4-dienoyl-CoA reductase-like NADH-dependent reductase (Old Yellow Enzyme family)